MTTRRKILASTLAGLVVVGSGLGISAFASSQQATDEKVIYEGTYERLVGINMDDALDD